MSLLSPLVSFDSNNDRHQMFEEYFIRPFFVLCFMQMSSEIMMVSFFIILLSSYLHCSLKLSRSLKNAVGKQEVPSKHG